MSSDDRFDLVDWLTFKRRLDFSKARWLGPLVVLIAALLVVLAVAAAFTLLGKALFGGLLDVPGSSLGVGGVTVALIGAPFVIWRSIVAQKSVDVQEQGQITDRINKAVEGLGAEKAVSRVWRNIEVEENGVTHTYFEGRDQTFTPPDGANVIKYGNWQVAERTKPNLEVRIGAIYALERISQDSARDHIQIMEILCAYIRQNAGRENVPLPDGDPTPEEWKAWAKEGREHPRLDVDVALKVIERRSETRKQLERDDEYNLGLERTPLRKIILSQRCLEGADLRGAELQGTDFGHAALQRTNLGTAKLQGVCLGNAELQGANLAGAKLQGADLSNGEFKDAFFLSASLQGADLGYASLQGAYLGFARLQRALLMCADLQDANLGSARLQGADLSSAILKDVNLGRTRLQEANLGHANLQRAYLGNADFDEYTNLSNAKFQGAALRLVNCTNLPQFAAHVQDMFGDASVKLPGGHGPDHDNWPKHWPKFHLAPEDFETEWRKWQADPENYTPPDPPKANT